MQNVVAKTEYHFARLSPMQVYDAWLDPALVRRWMTRNLAAVPGATQIKGIEIDPRVGGRYHFASLRDGESSDSWGYYRELEPGRRLVFTWFVDAEEEKEDNSTVTLLLDLVGSGTRAVLSHEMDARWAEYVPQTAEAWQGMLRAVDETLGQ
jgi:uncharacterized protein YndB with AHSA1/START domain